MGKEPSNEGSLIFGDKLTEKHGNVTYDRKKRNNCLLSWLSSENKK